MHLDIFPRNQNNWKKYYMFVIHYPNVITTNMIEILENMKKF